MSANLNPIFVKEGNFFPVRLSGTSSVVDGSNLTNVQELVVAGLEGTRVDGVRFFYSGNAGTSNVTPNAKVYRIYLTDMSGVNPRLIGEQTGLVTARNLTTVGSLANVYTFDQPIIMRSGQKMLVSMSSAVFTLINDQTDVIAFANNY